MTGVLEEFPVLHLPDISDPAERKRLGPAALNAFHRMMQAWQISDEDADRLLDGIPADGRQLSEDQMLRISCLLGIWKALRTLFNGPLADMWIRTPNEGRLYDGISPLRLMMSRGLPAFEKTRQHLDAMCA
jgi:hypothetical protein|tara:strand:+ start:6865 stop:7257 length:393 start_codon:yes stop_codon:yes gene_type:complete